MKRILTAAILLAAISAANGGEQVAKPVGRALKLRVRMRELQKKEDGKDQAKFDILHRNVVTHDNEVFKIGTGTKREFPDSGESIFVGDRIGGKLKLADPQNVIVDLKITVAAGRLDAQPSGAVLVTGTEYQFHSNLKLGELGVFMLTKPDEGRPRWLEIVVTHNDR